MRLDTETRAFRSKDGSNTTIKLEERWWTLLELIAKREEEAVGDLLRIILERPQPSNRSSFVRLWIADYLFQLAKRNVLEGDLGHLRDRVPAHGVAVAFVGSAEQSVDPSHSQP